MLVVFMVQVLVHGLGSMTPYARYGVMLPKIMLRFRASVAETSTKMYWSILMKWSSKKYGRILLNSTR